MSISAALNNAVSGLTASSRMAEIVSSNVANAQTEGYGRRVVDISASDLAGKGAGVSIDGVRRIVDEGIIADRRSVESSMSGMQLSINVLKSIESRFGSPDGTTGLLSKLTGLQTSLISASTDPSSNLRLDQSIEKLSELSSEFRAVSGYIQQQRMLVDTRIEQSVSELNNALQQTETLNSEIHKSKIRGLDATALMDERQRVVDRIAKIIPIKQLNQSDGRIALYTVAGVALIDGSAQSFNFTHTPTITAEMTIDSGALDALALSGEQISPTRLGDGELGALFQLRDQDLVKFQTSLDEAAADLIFRLQSNQADPSISSTDLGLLTDEGQRLDTTDFVGVSARIEVNDAIDILAGGSSSKLRDGLYTTANLGPGNSTQIQAWSSILSSKSDLGGQLDLSSMHDRISSTQSLIITKRITVEDSFATQAARFSTLKTAELSIGVDTDVELQKLLQIESSYAANAKVIQAVDTMLQRLMEI